MTDDIDIGPTPPEESCAQVGADDYMPIARRECVTYIKLIRRTLGPEPTGARLVIRSNPHDFGVYLSVNCVYDDEIPAAVEYAFKCESDGPATWDDQARKELSQTKAVI